jgi:hypothetical protein
MTMRATRGLLGLTAAIGIKWNHCQEMTCAHAYTNKQ